MKWLLGTTLVIAAMSMTVGAQAMKDQTMPMKAGDKTAHLSYTGCIESASDGGLLLTHVEPAGHSSMKDNEKSKMSTTMAHDASMPKDAPSDSMNADHMMSADVRLARSSNLQKHVGQKVAIVGSPSHEAAAGMPPAIVVSSLKVVSRSCS